jgi:hypothetical protein
MALLGFRSRPDSEADTARLRRLPSGSFTLDPAGRVVASTLPRSYPAERIQQVAEVVMRAFEQARVCHMHLSELIVDYPALKLTARELRRGAIIFLAPRGLGPG